MTVYRAASNFPRLVDSGRGYADGLSDRRQRDTSLLARRAQVARSLQLAQPGTHVLDLHSGPAVIATEEIWVDRIHAGFVHSVPDELAERRARRTRSNTETYTDLYKGAS